MAGTPPSAPVDASGKAIEGNVDAFFIITAEGQVKNPVVISSSDPQLSAAVMEALAHRVYAPARIDGRNVAATAGEEFVFPLPAR
jgi:outer membrane biosynthesis protein TonB